MESYQENIIAFIKGTLSGPELQAFKAEMEGNSALAEEVLFQQKLLFVLDNKGQIDAHDMMKEAIEANPISDADIANRPDKDFDSSTGFSWWPFIGLFVSALLIFGIFKFLNPPKTYYQQLGAEYNLPMENLMNVGAISNEDLAKGMRFYDNKNYANAIPLLEKYCNSNKDDIAEFYLAICRLQENQFEFAVNSLKRLDKGDNDVLKNKIKHYLSVGYLFLNNYIDAQKTLLSITPTERNQEIIDLLEKIEKK